MEKLIKDDEVTNHKTEDLLKIRYERLVENIKDFHFDINETFQSHLVWVMPYYDEDMTEKPELILAYFKGVEITTDYYADDEGNLNLKYNYIYEDKDGEEYRSDDRVMADYDKKENLQEMFDEVWADNLEDRQINK